jgi:hypothetical protein
MPAHYLWDDNALEQLREETRKRKETERLRAEHEAAQAQRKQEQLEREQLALLKRKYEGGK